MIFYCSQIDESVWYALHKMRYVNQLWYVYREIIENFPEKSNNHDFTDNRLCLGFVIMCLYINLPCENCQDLLPSPYKNISSQKRIFIDPK